MLEKLSKSRNYIQSLSVEEREALADAVGSNSAYLYQIGTGRRTPSRRLALKLQQETAGKVKAADFNDLLIA